MLHLQRTRLLLIVVLGVGSLHGCGFVGFATTKWMNRKDLPEDIRAEQGDDLSDTYYGLLVYLEQMDEHVSLSAKARFVRAHYRKAGQKRANGKAWIERLQGFGRVLRTVMSEGERAKFVELLDDGYYFQVQLKQNIGGVQWRSTKGMYLDGAEPLPNSPRPEKSRKQDDPPQPNPDDLVLPISGAADLLTLDDERLVPIVLRHLLQEPVDPEYETAISAALVTHLETKLQRHEQSQLHVALLRWFTPAEADIIGAIVENDPQLSSRDGLKAEGGSQRPRTARVAFISRLARFDRERARKWTEKFAKDHRKFWSLQQSAGRSADEPWAEIVAEVSMTLTERETVRRTGILIGKSFPDLARPFIETCLKHGATRDNRIVIQNTLRNADVETRAWIANKYVDEWLELFAGGDGFTDVAKTKSLDYFHHSKDAFGVIQTLPDSEQRKIAEKLLKDLHVFVRVEGIEGCLTTFSEAEREQILTDALSHERRSLKMIKMILPRLPMDRRIRMARKTVVDRWGYSAIVTLHAIADAPQDVRIEIAGKAADRLTLTREVAAVLHDLTDEQLDDFKSRHTRPISKRNFNSRKPIKTIGAAVVERVKADRLK